MCKYANWRLLVANHMALDFVRVNYNEVWTKPVHKAYHCLLYLCIIQF